MFARFSLATLCSVLIVCVAQADEPTFLSRLNGFEYGKDTALPFDIYGYIRANNANVAALTAFAAAIKDAAEKSPTADAQSLACASLAFVGNDADIPFIVARLAKPEVFPAAVTALQQMRSAKSFEALTTFAQASKNPDQVAFILAALGRVRAAATEPFIASQTTASSPLVRRGAFEALAAIASPEALKVMLAATPAVDDGSAAAMIAMANNLGWTGHKDDAAKLDQKILDAAALPANLHLAAMRSIIVTELPGSSELLAKLFKERAKATEALLLTNFAKLDAATQGTIAAEIVAQSDTPIAVRNLQLIGKAAPLSTLQQLILVKNDAMRIAALKILASTITEEEYAKLLANYLQAPDQAPLHDAVLAMPAASNGWILAALAKASDPKQQVALIGLLKERNSLEAGAALLPLAKDGSPEVKKAAIATLAAVGAPKQAPALFDLFIASTDPLTQRDLAKALSISLRQSPDKAAVIASAAQQYATVKDAKLRDQILDLLGRSGEPAALPVLFAEYKKADKARKTIVLRAITYWTDDAPLDQLAEFAANDPEPAAKIFSLRAYLDILSHSNLPPDKKVAWLAKATKLAQRPEEQKMIISQLATVPLPEARKVMDTYKTNDAVKEEYQAGSHALIGLLNKNKPKKAATPEDEFQGPDEHAGEGPSKAPVD